MKGPRQAPGRARAIIASFALPFDSASWGPPGPQDPDAPPEMPTKTPNADAPEPAVRLVAPGEKAARSPRVVVSNSFAFGGSNASLVFVKE
mgnify:CR=1 FL=1